MRQFIANETLTWLEKARSFSGELMFDTCLHQAHLLFVAINSLSKPRLGGDHNTEHADGGGKLPTGPQSLVSETFIKQLVVPGGVGGCGRGIGWTPPPSLP